MVATVVFQNTASTPRAIGGNGPDFDYNLDCRNQQNEKMPFTLFGKRMLENRGLGKVTGGVLEPGGKVVAEIVLNRHVDLTLPGPYTITVSREVIANQGKGGPIVGSNAVSFQIVD